MNIKLIFSYCEQQDPEKSVVENQSFNDFKSFREYLENNLLFSDKDIRLLKLAYRFGYKSVFYSTIFFSVSVFFEREEE